MNIIHAVSYHVVIFLNKKLSHHVILTQNEQKKRTETHQETIYLTATMT